MIYTVLYRPLQNPLKVFYFSYWLKNTTNKLYYLKIFFWIWSKTNELK